MFYLKDGAIVPGISISCIKLGMSRKELVNTIGEYRVNDLCNCKRLECGDVHIWVDDKTDKVFQIMVLGDFKGKFAGCIGIGSKLTEVLAMGDTYHEDLDTFVIDSYPGMCFELGDTPEDDDWDELRAPIEYISVFDPESMGGADEQESGDRNE